MKHLIITRTMTAQTHVPLSAYQGMTVEEAVQSEKKVDSYEALDMIISEENAVQSVLVDVYDDGKVEE
jgi:hypothetical protein